MELFTQINIYGIYGTYVDSKGDTYVWNLITPKKLLLKILLMNAIMMMIYIYIYKETVSRASQRRRDVLRRSEEILKGKEESKVQCTPEVSSSSKDVRVDLPDGPIYVPLIITDAEVPGGGGLGRSGSVGE